MDTALREQLLTPPDGPVEVVIDTDVTNEIDDQFALAWALLRPDRLTVRALTACPYSLGEEGFAAPGLVGEHELAEVIARRDDRTVSTQEGMLLAAQECRTIAALAGVDVPVVHGAGRYLPDQTTPVRSDAAELIVELASEPRERPLHVLAIGCATNLASALLLDPTIQDKVVLVWTSAYPTYWPYSNASYNLVQDLPAGRVLFDSGAPLVYLPGYHIGEQLRTTLPELREYVRGRGPLGDYLYALAEQSLFFGRRPGASKVIWDLIAVAYAVDPALLSTRLVRSPRLGSDLRWQDARPDRHVVREAHALDRDGIYGDLFRVLAGQDGARADGVTGTRR